MNFKVVLFLIGNLLMILGGCLIAPLLVAYYFHTQGSTDLNEVFAFGTSASISIILGFILRYMFKHKDIELKHREGFAVVSLSWVAMTLIGMLPYLFTGATGTITNAFFETISGFTTTGASIFPQVEVIPPGLQFWRCMTQWLGGMGIIVLSVALLPALGAGGYRMLKAEAPGGAVYERDKPRITDAAKELWWLYILLSFFAFAFYRLAGMTTYDAICHAFTTLSTGGFSSHSESAAYFSAEIQWLMIIFMFLAGINFTLHARLIRFKVRSALSNPELQLYTGLILLVAIVSCIEINDYEELETFESVLRASLFQVLSVVTTTGFATENFDLWPPLIRYMLLLLMFFGGCMGSTAGGMKMARILIYVKSLLRELHRPIFPHAVRPLRVGKRVLENTIVTNVMAFGLVFMAAFVAGSLVMAAAGYDIVTATSASVAALGNIGPGLGQVGPNANWAHLPDFAKWTMGFLMLLGRLELFSVLILFTPWLWRR
jgi:trk system potassium uptake protein TrkH